MRRALISSFKFAYEGISYCIRNERNFRIHLCAAFLAVVLGGILRLNHTELLALFLSIAFVLTAEMVNTAVEKAVDIVSPEYHPLAKIIKDVMAGSVLVSAALSVVVGVLLFLRPERILYCLYLLKSMPYLFFLLPVLAFGFYKFIKF